MSMGKYRKVKCKNCGNVFETRKKGRREYCPDCEPSCRLNHTLTIRVSDSEYKFINEKFNGYPFDLQDGLRNLIRKEMY